MEFSKNIPESVLDEIALEGLDGITLNTLWYRLKTRKGFPVALDDLSKDFIWKLVCNDCAIEFFLLKDLRPPLVDYNRYNYIDPEVEIICEPDTLPEDIYPIAPVEDKEKGIRGSCSTYQTRKNITYEARQLSLTEAVSRYGERLAIVACQAARDVALAGVHAEVLDTLVINSYIMLERIGRSREHGESTQGKHGLSRLNIPPKSAFYFRKRMLANGILVKQPISMRVSNRNVLGTLLHLPRFFSLRLPKVLMLIKRLLQILKDTPNHLLDYNAIREKLCTTVQLKKILATNELRQYIEIEHVPYRTLFPKATIKEWKMKNNDSERTIKVVRLVDPSIDPEHLFMWEETPPEDGSVISEEDESTGSGILTNATIQEHNHSIIRQAYKIVEASGSEGITQAALAEKLGLSQLDARSALRALTRLQLVDCVTKEVKKNRVFLYITTTHFGENSIRAQYEQEQAKVREFMQNTFNENSNDTSRSGTPDSIAQSSSNVQLEKDVVLREEDVKEEKGLFRANVCRKIFVDEGEAVNSELTHRSLKRVNIILEAIRTHMVIEEAGVLLRLIMTEEAREGVDARIDRRSLRRLLARLAHEGQIKQMRIVLRCGERERALNFICQPGIDQTNSVIRSAVDQAKLKLFCIAKNQLNRTSVKPERRVRAENIDIGGGNVEIDPSVTQSVQEAKEKLLHHKQGIKLVHNSSSGRFYGVEPKCIRVKEMHRLFFYLVYGYTGIKIGDQTALKEEVLLNNPEVDEAMLENIPNLYQPKVGWNMFVEPLPAHNGWGEGWSFLCDILLRLPLSIFVKVVNVTYEIQGLEDFLKHPIKKHLLLKHLPMDIRQGLIYARKYIFTVHDVVTNMVHLGLAQFGPSSLKEKDQVFIYLNRRTSILDTTPSAPGYHHISRDIEYDKKEYYFECMEDVEKYWYEVWHVCTNTLLGSINTMAGQSITLEMLRKKPAMVEAVRPRDPEEAPKLDNGEVPGDRLGAAGFDSAFFAHLKRNWTYNKMASMVLNRLEQQVKKTGYEVGVMKHIPEPQVSHAAPGRLAGLRSKISRFVENSNIRGEILSIPVTTEPNNHESRGQKRKRFERTDSTKKATARLPRKRKTSTSKPIARTRIVKARKKRAPRRPYYDEKDRQALMLMRRLRVMWSAAEDSFLLLCKVASTYVTGSLRTMVPFCVVRDCLHETHVESRNKTSRACQRRVAYMMRNPTTEYQVVNAYQELEQDPEIITISGGGPITKSDRSVSAEKTEEITVERFRKVLDHLKSRYSQGVSVGSTLKLPASIEEFHKQYELVQSNTNLRNRRPLLEVHNIVDIYCSVVYNVIHSSMCTSEDKASWGFHLFNIYQQYPDSLVRSTLAKMKNDMMIAQRKRSLVKNKKYFDSPLTAVPYKLSITYIHLFLSRYQYQVFHRSYQHLIGLVQNEKQVVTEGVNLSNDDWPGIEIGPHDGGSAALAVSLFSLGVARFRYQIPDQIIIFDPKLKEHPEELDNLVKRYNNWVRDIDKARESNKDERVVSQRRRLGLTTAAAAGVNSVMPKLIPLEDAPSGSESQITLPISAQSGTEESVSRSGYDRHQSQLIIRTASRIGLHMLREDMVNDSQAMAGKTAPNHIQQEHFVINSCRVFVHLESNEPLERGWLLISPQKRQEILGSIQTSLPQEIIKKPVSYLEFYNSADCTKAVKADAEQIVQTIASKKEMGIPYHELPQAIGKLDCTTFTLEQHLSILTDCKAVIRVGVLAGRYVASQFISPWVIQSFRLLRSGKEKLVPFDAGKVSKHLEEDLQDVRAVEETSTMLINEAESNDQSTEADPKGAKQKKRDRKVSQVSEAESAPGLSESPKGEYFRIETTNSQPQSHCEASQNDTALSSNAQECIATRRKRRITAPTQHNIKRAKTIETLGDEDRINLLVHVKPWVKIDGSLNRRVLDRLLGAVHSHIMTKPGCTIRQLAERFHPALQAFQTRELIEILEKIGCVQLYSIVRQGKPGPFAPRTTLTKVPYNIFMKNEEVFCDPKVDGILRLGEFIGDKKYERDYIPKCSCHNYTDS